MPTTFATSRVIAAVVGVIAAVSLAGPALAKSDNGNAPPGNNGTIKIDEFPMDGDTGNQPHVGCQFGVNFFGYDAGTQTARLVFEGHPPTGGGSLEELTTSWTTADRTGGNQLDTSYGPVDLSAALAKAGVTPDKQGYHVRLTVHVTGSQGADTKHKVFWMEACPPSPAAPAATPPQLAPGPAAVSPAVAAPATAMAAASAASSEAAAAVMGEKVEAASVETPSLDTAAPENHPVAVLGEEVTRAGAEETNRSGALPFTGSNIVLLVIAAVGFIAAGKVALQTVRSRP